MNKSLDKAIIVNKGWGQEEIFVSNHLYCGKILRFNSNTKSSMHYHLKKDETWYVLSGRFILKIIDPDNASQYEIELTPNSIWRNEPGYPHQVFCIDAGDILEVSTPDSIEDNFRVFPGDSQL